MYFTAGGRPSAPVEGTSSETCSDVKIPGMSVSFDRVSVGGCCIIWGQAGRPRDSRRRLAGGLAGWRAGGLAGRKQAVGEKRGGERKEGQLQGGHEEAEGHGACGAEKVGSCAV